MSLYTEFKVSLKSPEAEEIFDLLLFRPISFIFVKIIYNTSITPNQISIIALVFGVLSGILYGFGTYDFFIYASVSFFLCNMLDCADGQLARLKRNGTKIGRVVDGFIDYITSISIFLGLGIALTSITGDVLYSWGLTVAGGISKALQNMYFDHYRNMYMEYVYNKASNVEDEIKEYTEEKEKLKRENAGWLSKLLIDSYLGYSKFQKRSTQNIKLNVSPARYKRQNKFLLRLWSWIGSTSHLVALIICSVLDRIDWYLIGTITIGNVVFILLLLWQKSVINSISNLKR